MLRSLKDLEGYTLTATDGDIGTVVNFLLDDEHWAVRYLVADTDGFFDGRRVLISPISLRNADWSSRRLHVALTKDKVKTSPGIDADLPVSRQHERDYHRHFGYPYYWDYPGLWGMASYPSLLAAGAWPGASDAPGASAASSDPEADSKMTGDSHLRSATELRGYHIQGTDDGIGHVADFIVDDEKWVVRYLVIDTSNWWFGKRVLVAPNWASRIDWVERKVHVDLSRRAIEHSPEWNTGTAVNRAYEMRLYDYYGRPVYWDSGKKSGTPPSLIRPIL